MPRKRGYKKLKQTEKPKQKNKSGSFAVLVILLFLLAIVDLSSVVVWKLSTSPSKPVTSGTVSDIVDGSTFRLNDGNYVRLIGISVPEVGQPYFAESARALEFLIKGKEVRLELDSTNKDSSGKLLRYAYVTYNNQELFVNQEMIKQGLAVPAPSPPDTKYSDKFDLARLQCLNDKINLCSM